MLNIFKNIWIKPHRSEERINSEKVKQEQLLRLYDEYEKEMDAAIVKDSDYTEIQTIIYEKEKEVLQILNALDILYKSKDTTRDNLEEDYRMSNPFLHQEELDIMRRPFGPTGYTGPTGAFGSAGTTGFTGPVYYPTNPQFTTYTNSNTLTTTLSPWTPQKNP